MHTLKHKFVFTNTYAYIYTHMNMIMCYLFVWFVYVLYILHVRQQSGCHAASTCQGRWLHTSSVPATGGPGLSQVQGITRKHVPGFVLKLWNDASCAGVAWQCCFVDDLTCGIATFASCHGSLKCDAIQEISCADP